MADLALTDEVRAARDKWRYRGQSRPPFAEPVGPGEESVWDFPRPPRIEPVAARVRVLADDVTVTDSSRALRVVETAGAPTYYLPPEDVDESLLENQGERSVCEWKGIATSFAVCGLDGAAWSYRRVFEGFEEIRGAYAFYPTVLACFLDAEQVTPQPGGFYGGWVTDGIAGPVKGEPGTESW